MDPQRLAPPRPGEGAGEDRAHQEDLQRLAGTHDRHQHTPVDAADERLQGQERVRGAHRARRDEDEQHRRHGQTGEQEQCLRRRGNEHADGGGGRGRCDDRGEQEQQLEVVAV